VTTINLDYQPRHLFVPFHKRKERWACIVAHRRAGKTVSCIADLGDAALRDTSGNGRYGYIAPLFSQAKDIAWEYLKAYLAKVPGVGINESELRVDLPNGSRIRLYGAENYDRMRGLYFDGVVLDEPADFPVNAWPTVIRPALSDRKGWAVFIGTPKGKNGFWEVYEQAKQDSGWYVGFHPASRTGVLDQEELDAALKVMGEDRYQQEYECSFEAAIQGAYFGREMKAATEEGRICAVPHEPSVGVVTSWDLGVGDSTAIWFMQMVGQERRLIDYYESSGVGLDHYVHVLGEKKYNYTRHILPHDVKVRELGSGKSRLETLGSLGVRPIEIAPQLRVDDGIQAARSFLATCWFDEERCARGIEALRQYRRDFNEKGKTWRDRPMHDWTSHGADSFRYMATGNTSGGQWESGPIRRNLKGVA